MAGWSHEKREKFEEAFYVFLNNCFVNSKNTGFTCLGENLYDGQVKFITTVLDGLENDIHKFYVLKSRQLGLSTISRALSVFYIGVHKGISGALVFDTAPNRELARVELEAMIDDLPTKLKFPAVKATNREGLTLVTKSKILFKAAGVKKSAGSGGLGRSAGLSMSHLSELCSFTDPEGLESFENSLSDEHPDRLYIYESTARGFNLWHELWTEARKDTTHCACLFLGWWSHNGQEIKREHPDFQLYGTTPPTQKEADKIRIVRERYGVEITPEKLAWIRRKMDPTATREGDADPEFEGNSLRIQEQPWCVTADTRVGTNRGIVPIFEAINARYCSRGKIVAGGPTGKAEIWKVKTKLGYAFRGTANHPLIGVDNTEIALAESLGRRVRLQPPVFATEAHTISWNIPPAVTTVEITPDLARFVGLFMGDGSASNSGKGKITEVSICCDAKDVDVIAECVRLFKSVFGVTAGTNARDGWVTVRTGQKHVLETLKRLGLLRNDTGPTQRNVHVPEFIWRSPKPLVREFLSGLFEADGFNAYETNRVALFSKYPKFISDIQLLLLAFGITSRSVSMQKKAGEGHFYTGNQLELRTAEAIKFNTDIGFISARKRGRFDPEAYEAKWTKRRRGNSKRPIIAFEDEVVSVERENGIEEVWNLTVEGEHLFDANGILTHNTEEEAFQQTGSVFFPQQTLTEITHKNVSNKYSSWMFLAGSEFADMKVIKAPNTRNIDLRIWEEPDPDGVYAVGIDPAFGENEYNDRSSIEVFRCYADGFDQVAEYASPLINTRQLAWVIATIIGYYGAGPNAIVKYALELNGPGTAVFNEIRALKSLIDSGLQPQIEEKGLQNVFRNVRTYIYTRPDSMGSGQNYHIKTTGPLKITFLERFRDFVTNGTCRIRSIDLIDEMKTVAREGDSIKAPGNMKDDRVLSSSFAGHVWETGLRKMLMTQRRTREAEAARKRMSIVDQVSLFQQNQLQTFFDQKKRLRTIQQRAAVRQAWRYR